MENKVQVDIVGISTSPSAGGAFAIILKETEGDRRLPIIIGQFEAQSIALEIEGVKPQRPLTHDLMKNIIDSLGYNLTEIIINDLREGTFYAQLHIDGQEIDSRPSDAIALAVRYGVPIFVAEKVMEEASFVTESDEEAKQEETKNDKEEPLQKPLTKSPSHPHLSRLEALQKQLSDAITKEEYEKAARLRDEIRKLQLEQ